MKIELQLLSLILKSKLSWVKLLLPSSTVCARTGRGGGREKTSVGSSVCRFTAASQGLKEAHKKDSVLQKPILLVTEARLRALATDWLHFRNRTTSICLLVNEHNLSE
jgi:hypothetical protein